MAFLVSFLLSYDNDLPITLDDIKTIVEVSNDSVFQVNSNDDRLLSLQ